MTVYFVEANRRGEPNSKKTWLWVNGSLQPEDRPFNEVGEAAIAKGFNVSFCHIWLGVSHHDSRAIRKAVARALKVENEYSDIDIDVTMRMAK